MILTAPVSAGELIDKLSILSLKIRNLGDPAKRANAQAEHDALSAVVEAHLAGFEALPDLRRQLDEVNAKLWQVEDDLRLLEADGDFGDRFVALARSVYKLNDHRAALKREVNRVTGSDLIEEKSYAG